MHKKCKTFNNEHAKTKIYHSCEELALTARLRPLNFTRTHHKNTSQEHITRTQHNTATQHITATQPIAAKQYFTTTQRITATQ